MKSAHLIACLLALTTAMFACGDDDTTADAAMADTGDGDTGDGDTGDGDTGDGDTGDGDTGDGDTGDGDMTELDDVLVVGGPEPEFLQDVQDGWQVMLTADWEMPVATEGYYCARITLDRDVYFGATVPLSPLGTHHTLLSLEPEPSAPDGIEKCSAATNGSVMIAGSGVGTEALSFPEGVAMLAPKGSQMILNLHLYNPTEETLQGRSGTLVKTMDKADVTDLAVTTLAGPVMLDIPPGRVTQSGECTFNRDVTLVAVGPHMHQTGTYMKIVAHSSEAGDVVLYDGDYDFQEQRLYALEDLVPIKAGDKVSVDCTYDNDTDATIHFGDSSFSEMCFAGLSHFPNRDADSFICTF